MPRIALLCALALSLSSSAFAQPGACVDGVAMRPGSSIEYACDGVNLLGFVSLGQMGAGSGNDIWGWTDPDSGKEYALMGLNNGTAFVDVSTPSAPVYLGKLPTHTGSTLWRDVKVYADHVFVVSEANDHGMQVFDLTQLREVTSPQTFTATTHYGGIGRAHNVAINEATGFAYVVGAGGGSGCGGGLHMVNIQDPVNPTFAGCFDDDGYTHDAQCVIYDGPDTEHIGKEVCFIAQGTQQAPINNHFSVVDVTNKSNPQLLSQTIYPNQGYAHQGWLTEDHRYFIANDELDESNFGNNTRTLVFDVSDLNSPEFRDAFLHDTPAIDHNLYIKGPYVYQSNYRAGLRILDATELLSGGPGSGLEAVAFFDTYPSNDGRGFDGTWSNYPFFESGIVIVSDIDSGLFVLDPQLSSNPPVDAADAAAPGTFTLTQAYPNPFSSRTQFELTLGKAQHVDVVVYDVLGRRVADLFHGTLGAGERRPFVFDGSALPAGLYFVRVTGEGFAESRQVSLAR